MAELTREAFQEIQTRLTKETEAAEKKRVEGIEKSNLSLNKQIRDLNTKIKKASGADKAFYQAQIKAAQEQVKDNKKALEGEREYRNETVKKFDEREAALQELAKQIEGTGRKAEQDAEFRREQNQLMIDKIDEQLKGDLTDSQREELKKERNWV